MEKIVFKINSLDIGGIERLTIDTMNLLSKEKVKLFLILDHRNNFLEKQLDEKIKKYYLDDLKLLKYFQKLEKNRNKSKIFKLMYEIVQPFFNKIVIKNINKFLKKQGIETFIDYTGEYKRYIKKIKCKKKILWQHASIIGIDKIRREKYKKRLSNYNLIVCVCDELKEEMIGLFPKLKDKFIRIYNFIDEKRIFKLGNDFSKLNELERKMMKEEYFVSLGRLTEGKGYKVTVEAFERILKNWPQKKLYIIGEGEYRDKLEKIIREKKLKDKVFLLGKKENPYIWLKNSQLFIHSSYKEGFGLVLVEAMFCKTPVISSDYKCGSKEILNNGELGQLYKTGDSKDLSLKIEVFLKNINLENLNELNRENHLKNFYKENIGRELRFLYK